jgi:hypothetical protein
VEYRSSHLQLTCTHRVAQSEQARHTAAKAAEQQQKNITHCAAQYIIGSTGLFRRSRWCLYAARSPNTGGTTYDIYLRSTKRAKANRDIYTARGLVARVMHSSGRGSCMGKKLRKACLLCNQTSWGRTTAEVDRSVSRFFPAKSESERT